MTRLHLVTGGSASGKSAYAEKLLAESNAAYKIYLATMKPWDEECLERIAKHRRQREQKGFSTLECFSHFEQITLDTPPGQTALLMECMSNLTANECYDTEQECCGTEEDPLSELRKESVEALEERIWQGIMHLKKQLCCLIIVTNEVFSDGGMYQEETFEYRRLLGRLNQRIAAEADCVTEVVYGIPVPVKMRRDE